MEIGLIDGAKLVGGAISNRLSMRVWLEKKKLVGETRISGWSLKGDG